MLFAFVCLFRSLSSKELGLLLFSKIRGANGKTVPTEVVGHAEKARVEAQVPGFRSTGDGVEHSRPIIPVRASVFMSLVETVTSCWKKNYNSDSETNGWNNHTHKT